MMDDMPDFKPLSMDERVERALAAKGRTHFSRADWDFENPSWYLDNAIYKAAPPSLRGTAAGVALVKQATTGALSDGQVVTWTRTGFATVLGIVYFRNQVADGDADREDTYYAYVGSTHIRLAKYVGGAHTIIEDHAKTWNFATNTWYKLRTTWWSTETVLYVRVERWDGEAWVTLGGAADADLEDANDLWKDETVNRTGVTYGTGYWTDDLEVWG